LIEECLLEIFLKNDIAIEGHDHQYVLKNEKKRKVKRKKKN